jgi:hypothetical protein
VRIYRQRDAQAARDAPTKRKRFRSVIIGPGLVETLRDMKAQREEHAVDGRDWLFLCPLVRKGRYSHRELAPPHRLTVHGWHEAVLEDAGLRDMPLQSLRHTAAAAWLATGHSLIFVQRQLGHASITTTEEHYGHLEVAFMHAVARTEAKSARPVGSCRPPRDAVGLASSRGTCSPRRRTPTPWGYCRGWRPGRQSRRAFSSHCSISATTNRTGPSSEPSRTWGMRPSAAAW